MNGEIYLINACDKDEDDIGELINWYVVNHSQYNIVLYEYNCGQ